MTSGAAIAREHPDQAEIRALLAARDGEMQPLYPPEFQFAFDMAGLIRPDLVFLVARLDGKAVGMGAFLKTPEPWVEIKSMFVAEEARGQGLAAAILARLEDEAKAEGYTHAYLETGTKQLAAIALYERAGYVRRAPFGAYQASDYNIFLEKKLS